MARIFNRDFAAKVLVASDFAGDQSAANQFAVTDRTIRGYRQRLGEDDELMTIYIRLREQQEADWGGELPSTIKACINFLKEAARVADKKDPDVIHAIAGALKIVTDVTMSKKVIDARLTSINNETREDAGSYVTDDSTALQTADC